VRGEPVPNVANKISKHHDICIAKERKPPFIAGGEGGPGTDRHILLIQEEKPGRCSPTLKGGPGENHLPKEGKQVIGEFTEGCRAGVNGRVVDQRWEKGKIYISLMTGGEEGYNE